MIEHTAELRFQHGQAGAASMQKVVDEMLSDLVDPTSAAAELARQAGLDPARLATAAVSVKEEQQGFDALTATILVTIVTDVSVHVITRFWDDVIWRRIRSRIGADALGDER